MKVTLGTSSSYAAADVVAGSAAASVLPHGAGVIPVHGAVCADVVGSASLGTCYVLCKWDLVICGQY